MTADIDAAVDAAAREIATADGQQWEDPAVRDDYRLVARAALDAAMPHIRRQAAVVEAAKAWRAARHGPISGDVCHSACNALADAVLRLEQMLADRNAQVAAGQWPPKPADKES